MTSIALVCGLEAEARIARRHGLAVACSGSDAGRADALARRWLAEGFGALVSFGVAGGLDPALVAGDVIAAAEIIDGGDRWVGSVAWRDRLAARLPGARLGMIVAPRAVVADRAAKRELHRSTGAMAVDLESGAVARAAAAAGVPFVAVRAVADDARRTLLPHAATLIDARGRVAWTRVAVNLARRPGLVVSLIGLALDTRRALAALDAAAAALAIEPPP